MSLPAVNTKGTKGTWQFLLFMSRVSCKKFSTTVLMIEQTNIDIDDHRLMLLHVTCVCSILTMIYAKHCCHHWCFLSWDRGRSWLPHREGRRKQPHPAAHEVHWPVSWSWIWNQYIIVQKRMVVTCKYLPTVILSSAGIDLSELACQSTGHLGSVREIHSLQDIPHRHLGVKWLMAMLIEAWLNHCFTS